MKAIRFTLIAVAALAAVSVFAQNSAPFATPNGRNGKNFWFGNSGTGPSLHSSAGYDWDANNRAWYEYDGSGGGAAIANNQLFKGQGGVSGSGNAFTSFAPGGFAFSDVIQSRTTVNVRPYVYVDGYFGLIADVQGWGNSKVDLGSSTFYVLHNTPVYVRFNGFTDANQISTVGRPNGRQIPVDYSATVKANYPNPGHDNTEIQYLSTITFGPRSTGNQFFYLDPVSHTNFFGRIDIARSAQVAYDIPAGTYQAIGTVVVSSF